MKVAVGCLAVGVILGFLLVAGLLGFGYWAKNKVQEFAGGGPAVEEARKAANAVPFARPAGGVIPEPRLVQFIEVRAAVFSVYEKYRSEIDARVARLKAGQSLEFGDLSTGLALMGELQKAETLALAKHGMSEDEYAFINGEVYKAMWTDLGAGEAGRKAVDQAALAARAAGDALKGREAEGGLPPEAREALAKAREEIAEASRNAAREMENAAATAPENVALFKKYETELKKYAMPGLNLLFDEKARSGPAATPTAPGN
jgi:uncharacterized iron-regulated membrane protein